MILREKNTVPFTYEAKLSGNGNKTYHENAWYSRIKRLKKSKGISQDIYHNLHKSVFANTYEYKGQSF